MAPVTESPAAEPREAEDPTLFQDQGIIMLSFVLFCILMMATVCVGDVRSNKKRASPGADGDLESQSDAGSNGKGLEPSETTPLLSSDCTLTGSPNSSSHRSDTMLSWPSARTSDSQASSSTLQEAVLVQKDA